VRWSWWEGECNGRSLDLKIFRGRLPKGEKVKRKVALSFPHCPSQNHSIVIILDQQFHSKTSKTFLFFFFFFFLSIFFSFPFFSLLQRVKSEWLDYSRTPFRPDIRSCSLFRVLSFVDICVSRPHCRSHSQLRFSPTILSVLSSGVPSTGLNP